MRYNTTEGPMSEGRPVRPAEEQNIFRILNIMKRIFIEHWLVLMVLFAVIAVGYISYSVRGYVPQYESYVTYAVSTGEHYSYSYDSTDITLAERISNSFGYLMGSNKLSEQYYAEMGLTQDQAIPVSISATHVEETNFVTIHAVSGNPVQAHQAIQFVVREFDELISIILSNVEYTVVEQSGVLDTQINTFSWRRPIVYGVVGGLAVVIGLLYLMAYLSESVRSYEDIRSKLNIPLLGGIPAVKLKRRKKKNEALMLISNTRISADFKEAVYQIRSRVEKTMKDKGFKVLLLSSSVPSEGKTTVSANLAAAMAERGEKVLLIDGDLRNPSIAGVMSRNDTQNGVLMVLEGKAELSEAVIHLGENRPDLLCGRDSRGETGRYIASKAMKQLIRDARAQYDFVIVDTPPSAMITDAAILAGYADAIAYVIRQDYTKVRSVEEGVNLLGSSGTEVLGCIFNGVEKNSSNYGYGRYSYAYGKYSYGYKSKKGSFEEEKEARH